jgi:hypothetical protein
MIGLDPSDYDRQMQSLVLSQSLRNAIPNILFYGAVALATLFVGGYWPIVGKIVCVLYGILLAVEVLRHSASLFSTLAVCFGGSPRREGKIVLALLVQVLETAAFAFFFWLLLKRFFLT